MFILEEKERSKIVKVEEINKEQNYGLNKLHAVIYPIAVRTANTP